MWANESPGDSCVTQKSINKVTSYYTHNVRVTSKGNDFSNANIITETRRYGHFVQTIK